MSLPPRYYKYLPKLFSFFFIAFSLLHPVVSAFADQDTATTSSAVTTYYRPIVVEFRNAKQLSDKELYLQYILSIPLSATTSAEFLVDQVTYTPTSTPRNEAIYIDLEVPEDALDSFVSSFNRRSEENVTNLSNSSTALRNNEEGVLSSGSSTIEEVSNGLLGVQSNNEVGTSSETVLGVGFAFPYATSTMVATGTISLLSQATTTQYTTYTPFANYVSDSRGFNTTYLTLNGQLVGAYTYQVGNEASTGKLTFVATNYLGTPVIETDDKGDIVQMDITDVFGNYVMRDQRKDNAYHNKGYTGHEYDDTTNLLYSHARYLDTTAHSFLSVDPMIYSLPQSYLTDPQQMNSYAYARNNPVVYTDPTGMFSLSGTLLNIAKSAVNGVTGYVNSFIINGQQTSNAINAWSQSFTNSAVNKILSYAYNPVQTAKSDYSSAVSSASSYGSALKTNGAQIWNAQTTSQGDAAMNGPAGGLIKTAATFGVVKTMEVMGGMTKASQVMDIAQPEKILHGNSLASQRPTWGYKLYSDSGELLKNGITSKLDPAMRYTQSFMDDKIMTAELFENRAEAYLWEYTQNLIEKGPLNKNMH